MLDGLSSVIDAFSGENETDLGLDNIGEDMKIGVKDGIKEGMNDMLNAPQGFRDTLLRWRAKGAASQVGNGSESSASTASSGMSLLQAQGKGILMQKVYIIANDPEEFRRKLEKKEYEQGRSPFDRSPFHRGF